jgi:urea transport system permease protein
MKCMKRMLLALLLAGFALASQAAVDAALLAPLAGDDPDARIEAINAIAATGDEDAARLLKALAYGNLYAAPDGQLLLVNDDKATDPATGKTLPLPEGAEAIMINNRMRATIDAAMSGFDLLSPSRDKRLAAAEALRRDAQPAAKPLLDKAMQKEQDPQIRDVLKAAQARVNLASPDARERESAVQALADSSDASLKPLLARMLEKGPDGAYAEPDEKVRIAAAHTLSGIDARQKRTEFIGNLFYGISLGSVLLLAALGLAITFGLMGVINMAHGIADAGRVCDLQLPAAVSQIPAGACRPVSARGGAGRFPARRCRRHAAGAHRDSLALRPAAGDSACHLGHQPGADAGGALGLWRAERGSVESFVDVGRLHGAGLAGAVV